MKVRPATVRDARVIAEIHVEAWRVAYNGVVPADVLTGQSVQRRVDWWTGCLKASNGGRVRVAVAASRGKVVEIDCAPNGAAWRSETATGRERSTACDDWQLSALKSGRRTAA